jgi:hypothetical protein
MGLFFNHSVLPRRLNLPLRVGEIMQSYKRYDIRNNGREDNQSQPLNLSLVPKGIPSLHCLEPPV